MSFLPSINALGITKSADILFVEVGSDEYIL